MPLFDIRLVCEAGADPVDGTSLVRDEEVVTVEADSPWEARTRAIRRMKMNPRGRLLRGYDAGTGEEISPPPLEPLRPARFGIDGLNGTYEGFTCGETWNGFAVPYFTLAEARRLAEDYAGQPPTHDGPTRSEYDAGRDIIRLYDPSSGEWDEFGSLNVDGRRLYPVGARYWTWSEVLSDGDEPTS